MGQEILINVTPQETRVAILEQGISQELHIERSSSLGVAGNIYRGKVCRVLPGMQSAFVEIGLQRAAFLHAADMRECKIMNGDAVIERPIQEVLHEGQSIVVHQPRVIEQDDHLVDGTQRIDKKIAARRTAVARRR